MAEWAGGLRDGWRRVPHPGRLSPGHSHHDEIVERHGRSLDANLPTYRDPVSGFSVFTSEFLARRGYCCESGCRHCPWVGGDADPDPAGG
ncbi:MAG: DUF5522 domain-containing protein [Actinomycetota bacterium]